MYRIFLFSFVGLVLVGCGDVSNLSFEREATQSRSIDPEDDSFVSAEANPDKGYECPSWVPEWVKQDSCEDFVEWMIGTLVIPEQPVEECTQTCPAGEQGPQGEMGPMGMPGLNGEQGPQGEMGPMGPPGINGSGWELVYYSDDNITKNIYVDDLPEADNDYNYYEEVMAEVSINSPGDWYMIQFAGFGIEQNKCSHSGNDWFSFGDCPTTPGVMFRGDIASKIWNRENKYLDYNPLATVPSTSSLKYNYVTNHPSAVSYHRTSVDSRYKQFFVYLNEGSHSFKVIYGYHTRWCVEPNASSCPGMPQAFFDCQIQMRFKGEFTVFKMNIQ